MKIAILQRVCTSYRASLFQLLSAKDDVDMHVFFGDDLPNSKVKSAKSLEGFHNTGLPTRFITLFGRQLVWHRGLRKRLANFAPDVIICEGESNFLNYLQAFWFVCLNPEVKLIQWTLGGLPNPPTRPAIVRRFVRWLRSHFDAYICYSSFGKKILVGEGIPEENIFVAVNVSDTQAHLYKAEKYLKEPHLAREELGIDDREFICLFVGAIEENKRLEVILEAFSKMPAGAGRLMIVGDGKDKARLESFVRQRAIKNVSFEGRVTQGLEKYYASADLFLLPGRGGMVISEAMACGLPVVACAADGTEHDLIVDKKNGMLLASNDAQSFLEAIQWCQNNLNEIAPWSANARVQINNNYNTDAMCQEILKAVYFVSKPSSER